MIKIQDNQTETYYTIKINSYEMDYTKLWGSSVKNMEGSTRATLIGIVPTIKLTTEPLYQSGANRVTSLLNQDYLLVNFFDAGSGTYQQEQFTCSDIAFVMIRENGTWYQEVSFTLTQVNVQGTIS